MLVQHVEPISRKTLPRSTLRIESDPAYLSAKLRELALRTYRAVRSLDAARSDDDAPGRGLVFDLPSRQNWTDLHTQIVQLERAFDAQHLDLLASYVAALREKVENCLG